MAQVRKTVRRQARTRTQPIKKRTQAPRTAKQKPPIKKQSGKGEAGAHDKAKGRSALDAGRRARA